MQVRTFGFLAALLAVGALVAVLLLVDGSTPAHGAGLGGVAAPDQAPMDPVDVMAEVDLNDVERMPAKPSGEALESRQMGGVIGTAEPGANDPDGPSPEVRVHLSGRFIDGDGSPLAGVTLASDAGNAQAQSDRSGGIELAFTLPAAPALESLPLIATLAGYVTLQLEPTLDINGARARIELGDVVLMAAGVVSGRVVDGDGSGVADARVAVTAMGPLGWGSRGSGPTGVLVETRSEANGGFRLDGVGAGEVRLWGGTKGWWWAHSDGVQVESGRETPDLLLRLEQLEPEDVIELQVVDPDYQPVPKAKVSYYYHQDGNSGSGTIDTDEQGAYRRVLERRAAFDFCARDPEDVYRPAVARGVVPGTTDLVLVLGSPRALTVRVRDPIGKSVGKFMVTSHSGSEQSWLRGASHTATEEGQDTVVFQLPAETFELSAEADGFESERLGPFDPEKVGALVDIELAPLPGIRGRVFSPSGKPAVGAEVGLHSAVAENTWLTVNGFAARSQKHPEVRGLTDEEGRFTLTLRTEGQFYLRAEHDVGAVGEIGPLDLDGGVGSNGLRVDLPEPGSIEGKLLLESGRDVAGLVIGISRADGYAITGHTDARGGFSFEGLTPGSWLVQRRNEEIRSGWTSSSSGDRGGGREFEWSCEVWPGRTTHFDLDLTQATQVVLRGRLLMGGNPPTGLKVELRSLEGSEEVVATDTLDSQGDFRLETASPGPFNLQFNDFSGRGLGSMSQEIVLVVGMNEWSADPPFGTIEGRVSPQLIQSGQSLSASWSGPERLRFSRYGSLEEDGSFSIQVPAGTIELTYGDAEPRQVLVPEGGVTQVDIP